MSATYLLIDLASISVPFIFSFHRRLRFDRQWKYFFPSCVITGLVFIFWDVRFTQLGIWNFNPDYLIGLYIAGLPVEEWLFFLCIPYACVFTYHCLGILLDIPERSGIARWITAILAAVLLVVGFSEFAGLYTSVTFLGLSATLILMQWIVRVPWMLQFHISYAVLLLPFIAVNGLLTGTWISEPVVRYNDAENLGIRFLTIPVEDIFYGMFLILLNVALLEFFRTQALRSRRKPMSV